VCLPSARQSHTGHDIFCRVENGISAGFQRDFFASFAERPIYPAWSQDRKLAIIGKTINMEFSRQERQT